MRQKGGIETGARLPRQGISFIHRAAYLHGLLTRLLSQKIRLRSQAAKLGRQHVRDGVISIKNEETGEWVTLRIPKRLTATIKTGPCGDLTYIAEERGLPLVKEAFGNQFREWCRRAGIDKLAHGLRKLAAITVFRWKGGRMGSHHTRSASRKALGLASSTFIEGAHSEEPIPRHMEKRWIAS